MANAPRHASGELRTERLPPIRLTPSERELLERGAAAAGETLSEFLLRGGLVRARRALKIEPGEEQPDTILGWKAIGEYLGLLPDTVLRAADREDDPLPLLYRPESDRAKAVPGFPENQPKASREQLDAWAQRNARRFAAGEE